MQKLECLTTLSLLLSHLYVDSGTISLSVRSRSVGFILSAGLQKEAVPWKALSEIISPESDIRFYYRHMWSYYCHCNVTIFSFLTVLIYICYVYLQYKGKLFKLFRSLMKLMLKIDRENQSITIGRPIRRVNMTFFS